MIEDAGKKWSATKDNGIRMDQGCFYPDTNEVIASEPLYWGVLQIHTRVFLARRKILRAPQIQEVVLIPMDPVHSFFVRMNFRMSARNLVIYMHVCGLWFYTSKHTSHFKVYQIAYHLLQILKKTSLHPIHLIVLVCAQSMWTHTWSFISKIELSLWITMEEECATARKENRRSLFLLPIQHCIGEKVSIVVIKT